MNLVGAIDISPEHQDQDAGELAGLSELLEVPITNQLEPMLAFASQEKQLGVMVDFTHPDGVYDNIRSAIAYGIRPVVGTTGLSPEQLQDLAEFADKGSTGCLVIPNFSIGMVLLQQAAVTASQYFDNVEIIELHHNQKADAPSGTAIKTAEMLADMGKGFNTPTVEEKENLAGARGCEGGEGIRIHSIRLPGLIAHQEVIFGAPGQIYTLRHDTSDRACYMPGVLLAIRKVLELKSLVYGLEKIL
ncbi:Dihydrodipicolinate reductase [Richelia intracellularis]|nr:Dihydrodipicolinate reductase [Richelia intracellularis]